jgi:hypothetical protein
VTPPSRSPQWWWSVKKTSSSVSRLTVESVPQRAGLREAREEAGDQRAGGHHADPPPPAVLGDGPVLLLDLQPSPGRPALVGARPSFAT